MPITILLMISKSMLGRCRGPRDTSMDGVARACQSPSHFLIDVIEVPYLSFCLEGNNIELVHVSGKSGP